MKYVKYFVVVAVLLIAVGILSDVVRARRMS